MSVARAPQPAAGAESWGRSERRNAAAAVRRVGREAGDPQRQSGPKSPRACRTLRELHEGTPKQRGARRVFVEVGNRASALRAVARFPRERRSALVDASRHATRRVSHLRKSKPYAQR